MPNVTNPHDRFFKEIFSNPETAEDFVTNYLPPWISDLIEPSSYRLRKDSFVDKALREHFSDLLYEVSFRQGHAGCVYILFEHKSYPDEEISFQLLEYMVQA